MRSASHGLGWAGEWLDLAWVGWPSSVLGMGWAGLTLVWLWSGQAMCCSRSALCWPCAGLFMGSADHLLGSPWAELFM
jgi:hypothetical protein